MVVLFEGHFQQGGSLGVMPSCAVPSSSGVGIDAPWLDKKHCHFVPVGVAAFSDAPGIEAVDVSSLPATADGWMVVSIPKMEASGTLPVRSWKGYISNPWALGGQAHKAAPEASTKAHQSCPSSAVA